MFWDTRKKIFDVVETPLEIMKRTPTSGEEALISGFAKFCVKEKRERIGRNSATGEDMVLAPRRVVILDVQGS
jgi:integration host factor subunit alpha